MPTVTFKISEVLNIVSGLIDEESEFQQRSLSFNQKENGTKKEALIIHYDENGKETYSDKDFDTYKSVIKVRFSERY